MLGRSLPRGERTWQRLVPSAPPSFAQVSSKLFNCASLTGSSQLADAEIAVVVRSAKASGFVWFFFFFS